MPKFSSIIADLAPILLWAKVIFLVGGATGCGSPERSQKDTVSPDYASVAAVCQRTDDALVSAFLKLRQSLFSRVPECYPNLTKLASFQREWLIRNKSVASEIPAHQQIPGTPAFTGATLQDRIVAAGLEGHQFHIAESISSGTFPAVFLQKHLASVFHRSVVLAPGLTGFGLATDEVEKLQVLIVEIDGGGDGQEEVYYPPGHEGVPTGRNFFERPFDQLKSAGEGFPVSVHFPWNCAVSKGPVIKVFKLAGPEGPVAAGIFSHYTTPAIRPSDVFLIPHRMLVPESEYTVTAHLYCGSREFKKSWIFSTN